MSNPLPESIRQNVWDAVRPVKHKKLNEVTSLPFPASVIIGNWTIGSLIGRVFGSDHWDTTGQI